MTQEYKKETLPQNGKTFFEVSFKASLFTSSKPDGRAPKNSFCKEPMCKLANITSTDVNNARKPANFPPCIAQFDWLVSD